MAEATLVALLFLSGLAGPFVLYVLIRSESPDREEVSREEAERTARRDTDGGDR